MKCYQSRPGFELVSSKYNRDIILCPCVHTLAKHIKKKLDGNCTRMLWAILNKSWKQHVTKQQLYGHLTPISKTIQIRWTRHARHCWRSKDELISDVILWVPSHRRASVGWLTRTYLQQLCRDTGCCLEDLPDAMNDGDEWRDRVREIHASSMTWWWWWWYYIISLIYKYFISFTSALYYISRMFWLKFKNQNQYFIIPRSI